MVDPEKMNEEQIALMESYDEVWERWVESRSAEDYAELQKIKDTIDTISMGMQISMMLQQINLQKSGLIVPGQGQQQGGNLRMV